MVELSRTVVVGLLCLASGIQSHRLIARQEDEPSLFIDPVPTLTTCEPSTVQWDFFGRQSPMKLIVSNIGIEPSSSTAFPGLINKTLSTTITPFSGAFEWGVDVPPGTYRFNASVEGATFIVQSNPFEVAAGPDDSCLALSSASSPAPSSTGSPSPSSQTFPIPQTPSSPTSSETSAPPAPVAASRSHTGTIVGAVLGVVGLGIVVLAAFFLIRRMTPIKSKHGHGKPGGRWNGLGSTDSRTVLANASLPNGGGGARRDRQSSSGQRRAHHYPGDSMASMQATDESFGTTVGGEKYTTSRKNSAATTHDDHEGMVLSTLPALPHSPSSRDVGRRPSYPDTSYSEERPRRNSRSQPISRSSSAANTPHQTSTSVPSTPAPDNTNRNSIGAGNGRKRKPVPAYNPSELAASPNTSPMSSPPTLVTPSPAFASSALDHEAHYAGASLQTPAAQAAGHYTTRNVNQAGDSNEALTHKSSFGATGVVEGKQMHYLMPDLPPDVRGTKRR